MRIFHRYVFFSEDADLIAELDRLRVPCALARRQRGDVTSVTGEFFLYEDDPAFTEKTRALERFALRPQEGTAVSREEEEAALWHRLEVRHGGYPQPENSWFERAYGGDGTCGTCGYHERRIAPFRFKTAPRATNERLLGLNWAFEPIFVGAAVKALFEEGRVSGVGFSRPVLHRTGVPLENVWQLEVDVKLQGGLVTDDLHEERCAPIAAEGMRDFLTATGSRLVVGPFCGRTKYNHPTRGLMTFDGSALNSAPDVVQTQEHFGSGGQSHRLTLVSKRVRELLVRHKLRGASLRPLRLV